MRQPLVAGNWKMHGSRDSVGELVAALKASALADAVEVAVCPTYVHLAQALELCAGSVIGVGAQDCSHVEAGGYRWRPGGRRGPGGRGFPGNLQRSCLN